MYFVPAVKANFSAATYQTCMGSGFIEPFDPRCRGWYNSAKNNQGKLFFQQPYVDALSGSVLMTSSIEIDLQDNTKIIYGMDFGITNMIKNIFTPQDSDSGGYTIIFHPNNHTIFHHKDYNVRSGLLLSWEDVEFNSTRGEVFTPQQKNNFTQSVYRSIDFMENEYYDILNFINVDQFFQRWTKGDQKFLVYPATISMPYNSRDDRRFSVNILMLGKVSKDITDLIKVVNLNSNPFFLISVILETIIMILIIFLFVLHYGALQYNQVEIPITILTQFLQQNYLQQEQNIKITVKGEDSKTNENKSLKKSRFYTDGDHSRKMQDFNISQKLQFEDCIENHISENISDNLRSRVDSLYQLKQFGDFQRSRVDSQFRISQQRNPSSLRERQISKRFISQNIQNMRNKQKSVSQDSKDNYADIKESLIEFLYNSETSVLKKKKMKKSDIQEIEGIRKVELKDIDPMFLEMSIILETFQKLENVIQYAISESNKGSIVNSLMRFSNAKRTFQSIQNNIGLGMCYFNIAQLHLQLDRYEEAIENLFASIECSLQEMNLSSLKELTDKINSGHLRSQVYNLRVLSKRLLGLSLVLKEQIKKKINYNYYITLHGSQSQLHESIKYLQICLQIVNLTYQSQNLQKYALFIEIAEGYLLINDYDSCVYYLGISEIFIQNYAELYQNKETKRATSPASPSTFRKNYTEENYQDQIQEESQFLFRTNTIHSPLQTIGNHSPQNSNFLQQDKQVNPSLPDCIDQINITILSSKIQFMQGILTCKESYYYLGSILLLQTIENYNICDPTLIYSAIVSLQHVLLLNNIDIEPLKRELSFIKLISAQGNSNMQQDNKISIESSYKDENQNKEDDKMRFDIVVVLQNPQSLRAENISTQTNFLKYLNQKFITPKQDRVSIITYNSVLKIIQPLVIIENRKQLNFCIYQIKNDYEQQIYQQYSGILQPNQIQQVIDPKIAFIAAFNFFRNERAKKYLKLEKQKQKEEQLEEILNNPIFKQYLGIKLRPLITSFEQKYEKTKNQSSKLWKQQSTDSNQLSLQTESISSLLNKSQKQKSNYLQLPDDQTFSFSFANQGNEYSLSKNNNYNQTYKNKVDESKDSEQNLTQLQFFDQYQTPCLKNQAYLNSKYNPNNNNSASLKPVSQLNQKQKSIQFEDSYHQQKLPALEVCQKSISSQIKSQISFAVEEIQQDQIQTNSQESSDNYTKNFELALFQSIKFFNSNQKQTKGKNQKPIFELESSKNYRKQLVVLFSFNDHKESTKNQIFEKISFTDDIEILHCAIQKQFNKDKQQENFTDFLQNDENKFNEQTINQNYKMFQDLSQLISYFQKLKVSKYYKYSLLSSYLGSNF